MDSIGLLERTIRDAVDRPIPTLTARRLRLPSLPGKPDVVVGMRRAGKTTFVFQQIQARIDAGMPRAHLLYLNFEDDRLLPLQPADLSLIPEIFYRLYPAARDSQTRFHFDEPQRVPGWEGLVRRLVDTENCHVVVTGSSARLLSREVATSLRGRGLMTELFPFDFEEHLRHTGLQAPAVWPPPARSRSRLANAFDVFMETGGFPEVQGLTADLRLRVLREYVDGVLFRDVVERHGVSNVAALRYLVRHLLRSPAVRFSVNRLYNDLRSQGVSVGKDMLHELVGHLEDAYMIFGVPIANDSLRVRAVNPRKMYLVDHALTDTASYLDHREIGHRLENIVYLALRRDGLEPQYVLTRSGKEVDFFVTLADGTRQLIQVCASLADSETRRREIAALDEGLAETGATTATIVTLHDDENVDLGSATVAVRPAWRWLLERLGPTSDAALR